MCPAHSLSHRLRRLRAAMRTLASISVAARYRCRVQGICASMRNFSSRILQLDQESLKQTKIIYSQVAAAPMLSLTRFFYLQSNHMLSSVICTRILACRLPSVLWRCWLGGRKGIRSVNNWVVGCWRGYLSGARCRLAYGSADATATHRLLFQ